jgi:heme/copper-type cytochrome/quinol oxidase subunit 2
VSTAAESIAATGADATTRGTVPVPGSEAVFRTLVAVALVGASAAMAAEDRIAIQAARSGFKPKVVTVRKGDIVHLVLTTADDEHCFAVDALRIEKRIVPGKPTEVDLTADQPGTLSFYCCLEPEDQAQRGRLVVTE